MITVDNKESLEQERVTPMPSTYSMLMLPDPVRAANFITDCLPLPKSYRIGFKQRNEMINFRERIIFGSLAGKKIRKKWKLPIYKFA